VVLGVQEEVVEFFRSLEGQVEEFFQFSQVQEEGFLIVWEGQEGLDLLEINLC
jgi:hypothetical protein